MPIARLLTLLALVPGAGAVRVQPDGHGKKQGHMLNSDALLEVASNSTGPIYSVDMLRLKNSGYSSTFCGLSSDDCQTLKNFPGWNTMNYLTWAKAEEQLQLIPELQDQGKIFRGNELGYIIMNDGLWARDYRTLGLGCTVEQHKFFRPIADRLLGSEAEGNYWSEDMIDASLADFLKGRVTLNTNTGVFEWTTRLMHKIHLNMDLSPEDTQKFMGLQNGALVQGVLPFAVGFHDLQDTRDYFLKKYIAAIDADTRNVFPKDVSRQMKHFMASSLMDSMLFAGGLSVGNLIKVGLAVLYADPSPWKEGDKQITDSNVDQFVFEVVRRYPAVVGFPWYAMPGKDTRFIVNLAMSLRDPRVWAESGPVLDFKLRPLETYKRLARVAWAEPANGPAAWAVQNPGRTGNLVPMSRGCPGQALSFAIIKVFFRRWAQKQMEWRVVQAPKGGLEFTDATPFVSEITLAKQVRVGPITLVKGTMFGYSSTKSWAVVTAGDALQPAMIYIFSGEGYRKDDPVNAVAHIVLDKVKVGDKQNYMQSEDKNAQCFKVWGKAELRLCSTGGASAEDNAADRYAWVTAIFSASANVATTA